MEIVVSTKLRYDSNSSSPKGIGFLQKFKLYQIVLKSFFIASLPDFDTGVNAAIILIGVVKDGVLVRVERVLDAVVVCVSCKVDDAAVGLVVPGEVIVVELHEGARRVDLRAVLAHGDGPGKVGRVLGHDALIEEVGHELPVAVDLPGLQYLDLHAPVAVVRSGDVFIGVRHVDLDLVVVILGQDPAPMTKTWNATTIMI